MQAEFSPRCLRPCWHRPCFNLRPAPLNTLLSHRRTGRPPIPVLTLPSRPAVQNKAHSLVLDRFAYCPRWLKSLESVSSCEGVFLSGTVQ